MRPAHHYQSGWDDQAGSYIATCTAYPGLSGYGDSIEDAEHSLEIAITRIVRGERALCDEPFNDCP
jgi:hypothetical protein